MAKDQSVCKTGLCILAVYVILSLQGADAQTTFSSSGPVVPGWGIALLVLMCIFLAAIFVCFCCAPFCLRAGSDGTQSITNTLSGCKCWN